MLFKLLALPITAPAAGIRYCLNKVIEVAEQELWDEGPVRETLILANEAFEEGRITEEEFRERETALLARLREIREYRKAAARAQAEHDAGAQVDASRTVVIELPEEMR